MPGEYQGRRQYLATIFFTSVTAHLDVSERRSDWGSLIPVSNVDKKQKRTKIYKTNKNNCEKNLLPIASPLRTKRGFSTSGTPRTLPHHLLKIFSD